MKHLPVVALVIAILAVYWIGTRSGASGDEDAHIIAAAENALAAGKAYRARLAKLRTVSHAHVTAARAATVTLIDIAPTLAPIALRTEIARVSGDWEAAFRAESLRADLAEARARELEIHLAATLTVAECHILGVHWLPRCPSRTATLLLGAGAGVTGAIVLRH